MNTHRLRTRLLSTFLSRSVAGLLAALLAASASLVAGPEIAIEQPPGAALQNSAVTFAGQNVGLLSASKTFTIKNSGSDSLTISSVTLSGANAGDFSVSTAQMYPNVSGSGQSSFSVSFLPRGTGSRGAILTVASNAATAPLFQIALSGTGLVASAISIEQPAGTVLATGTVVGWGSNGWGRTTTPAGLTGVVKVAAGDLHTVALRRDGTVLVVVTVCLPSTPVLVSSFMMNV